MPQSRLKLSARLILVLAMLLAFVSCQQSGARAVMVNQAQPIIQSGLLHAAGDYFATLDGQAVYLAGDHTWTDNVSYANTGQFNFNAFLNVLQTEDANFTRLWAPDTFANATNSNFGAATLNVFQRTGPGIAADGSPKFDLTQFNQAYFDTLHANVQAAAAKGVYVDVMLFFNYNMPGANYGTWASNPWNGANNINGTTTDNVAVEQGADPHLLALQEAYVAKTLDTLHDQPNVLYEISNEARYDPQTYAWQNTIIDFIHNYEASHGYLSHPVGMTSLAGAGSPVSSDQNVLNAAALASPADWVAPTGNMYQNNPPDAPGTKVVIADSDHIFGVGGNADWVWQQFTRGQNVLIMDDMSGTNLPGTLVTGMNASAVANEVSERLGVSETRQASLLVNMTNMTPSDSLSSTNFALANPAGGDYVVYAPNGGGFSVNLSHSAGQVLEAQWMNIATGQLSPAGTVTAATAAQGFIVPFSGAAALILTPAQSGSAGTPPQPSPQPIPQPSPQPIPPTPAPVNFTGPAIGSGPDTLSLGVSQDYWRGSAQFTVSVNGQQIGGVQTVDPSVLHNINGVETYSLKGDFSSATGSDQIGVSFINDDWGGTAATDRNLYVTSLGLDGTSPSTHTKTLLWGSTASFTVATPIAAPPAPGPVNMAGQTIGNGADTLSLGISQDYWRGSAAFTVAVDGRQIGGVQTVDPSVLHDAAGVETFTVKGNFGTGAHNVAISFINDDWGGTAATDRNLYVNSISYNGVTSNDQTTMLWSETKEFNVQGSFASAITAHSVAAAGMTFVSGGSTISQPAPAANVMAADQTALRQDMTGAALSQAKSSSVAVLAESGKGRGMLLPQAILAPPPVTGLTTLH